MEEISGIIKKEKIFAHKNMVAAPIANHFILIQCWPWFCVFSPVMWDVSSFARLTKFPTSFIVSFMPKNATTTAKAKMTKIKASVRNAVMIFSFLQIKA
ncbi:MAG: hypothetical protein II030_02925 [Treponema sp.]|nr:hypothetical protein [Treponema sp.]